MCQVSNIRVLLMPDRNERGSGLTGEITYNNPSFLEGLKLMFNVKPNERIRQVEFDEQFITVRLEHIPGGSK